MWGAKSLPRPNEEERRHHDDCYISILPSPPPRLCDHHNYYYSLPLAHHQGSFTVFVTLWRDTLLPSPMTANDSEGLPPPAFGTAGYPGQAGGQEEQYGGDHADVAVGQAAAAGGVL